MIKTNRKMHQPGEISPAAVSFLIDEPGSAEMTPTQSSSRHRAPPSPRNSRRSTDDIKSSVEKSDTLSPANLPSSPTQGLKGNKKCNSATTSRNSSVHSLLGFENSETSRTVIEQDKDKNGTRRNTAKNAKAITKKRQEINQVQKLLLHQQKLYISLYAQIKELEAKAGIEPDGDVEMQLLTIKGWPPHDLLLLTMDEPPDNAAYDISDVDGVLGPAILREMSFELSTIPKEVLDMGLDLASRRTKILENFRKRIPELKVAKNEYDADTEVITNIMLDTVRKLELKIKRSLDIAKTSWKDRDVLIKKIDTLTKELSVVRSKIKPLKENNLGDTADMDLSKKIESRSITDLKEKLSKERAARESMKHTVATAENMLRTARARITVLERDLKQTQKQLDASMRKHKEYEMLHRCRETSYDVRSKKLLQVSKTGEVTIEMLSLQRDALELRVKELQEQIKTMIVEYEARESEHQSCLERLQDKIEDQERQKKIVEARAMELEKRIKDLQDEYRVLLDQSDKLVKMSDDKCLDYLPHKENDPTQRETEIWKDLQLTKKKLARVIDELRQSREDKESLLNSLAKIAQEGSENNMATELLLREQKNFELLKDIQVLKENVKSLKENLAQKDNQLNTLRLEVSRLNYQTCSNESTKQLDLGLEVADLASQVANLTRERDSLMSVAMSRALMLERHERCAELFAQVTRTRREIAAKLAGRADRPHSEGAFDNGKLSISMSSSCLKAAETWAELRTDRERVLQLQDVVASQNLQLKRECRIRNQLEQRRAILERLFLNRAGPMQYVSADNVSQYIGASSYFVKDTFANE